MAWVERMTGRTADAFTLVVQPGELYAVRSFGRRLNGEREHLRQLPGPLLLLMNEADEHVLRQIAPDFFTWIAQVYALSPPAEILAFALQNGALVPPPGNLARTATGTTGAVATLSVVSVPPIRFLHLSDIHFKTGPAKVYDRSKVLQGLLERLRKDREKSPLDLVFFTGDLANAAAEAEYASAVEFLRELLDATGVDPARLFVVPGNHDVDRKIGRWALRTLRSDDESAEFFVETDNRRLHALKFTAYQSALSGLLGASRPLGLLVGGDAVEVVEVRGVKLAIASFNSAWFAVDDTDVEKLWLGEADVDMAAQRIEADKDVAFAIALMHHPTEYLAEQERSAVEKRLERSFDLILRGHLHRDKAKSVLTPRGGYIELAAPAAYQGSQWPNGCFVGELSVSPRVVRVRAYKFGAGADPWTLDHSVFPDDEDGNHVFTLRERRRGSAIADTFTTSITSSIVGAMALGDRATAFGSIDVKNVQPKEVAAALESSGGRLPEDVRKTLVERLALQIPPPPEPGAPWGPEAFEGMLHRLVEYWRAHRDEWLEALGDHVLAYELFAQTFFAHQAGQPVHALQRFRNMEVDLMIGADDAVRPRERAVIEIKVVKHLEVNRTFKQLAAGMIAADANLGALLWFQTAPARVDLEVIRRGSPGARITWLVTL
ncbi:MAG: metallophosphoesterase [Minicystis sp.]